MTTKMRLTPKIIELGEADYQHFIDQLPDASAIIPDISKLNDRALTQSAHKLASEIFSTEIDLVKSELSDAKAGIVAVDIPESRTLSVDDNAFWGVALATGFGSNVFSLAHDKINGTPFTIYAASYEKSRELTEFGLPTVAPETKLGFHTDGVIHGDTVSMPCNIMLYNVLIEYYRPGCFHWVPFHSWDEKKTFMERVGVGKRYSVKLAPSIYDLGEGKLEIVSPDTVDVPIFADDEKNEFPLYINGSVVGSSDNESFDPEIFAALKQSIADSRVRYSVPQRSRRIIFARNVAGAHARDIFEEPIPGVPYTRIFLRSVDVDAVSLAC
ncbi:hypothetical protein [Caballeronia sp. BR00000012568055]|uniref:hypothetical protein n=1 Tax=Caballeronia sp. BR00000012568055 TaxID=2918761 RepID=UPI0023F99237|nr:hypothetical protein [Caballeronia sp. BR00000012568055]